VDEPEMGGVERQTRHHQRVLAPGAVDGIGEHRVAQRREVNSHLVGAAGAEFGLDESDRAEPLERPDRGPRGLPAGCERGPPCARAGAADAAVDEHLRLDVAGHERAVAPGHRVRLELPLQVLRGRVTSGQHHDPRGVAVEAVDDVETGRGPQMPQGGPRQVEGGVPLVGLERNAGHSGRLVDDDHVGIPVDDADLQLRRAVTRGAHLEHHRGPAREAGRVVQLEPAVDRHLAAADPGSGLAPGGAGAAATEEGREGQPGLLVHRHPAVV
jgi:hypothetical protein